jgi:hypothetical protein
VLAVASYDSQPDWGAAGGVARAAATPTYPDSMAILGHSGATGEDSDPAKPHVEVRANSWATGTNPAVNSVYQRILAHNPKIAGHNANLARAGATCAVSCSRRGAW